MTPAIQQSAKFACSPKELFEMYIDSAKHTAATGMPARMSRRAGGKFAAFGERLRGSNLLVIPNRMVVQAWRSSGWKRGEPDSILVLEFSKAGRGSQVDLVHVGVPAHDHQGVTNGWPKYYWEPWKRYLEARGTKRGRRARA
jgi:activator of HSP90 ATPase